MVSGYHEFGKCRQAEQKVMWASQIGYFKLERLSVEILLGVKHDIQPERRGLLPGNHQGTPGQRGTRHRRRHRGSLHCGVIIGDLLLLDSKAPTSTAAADQA